MEYIFAKPKMMNMVLICTYFDQIKMGLWCVHFQIPNGLGLLFGTAQLLLYATYYKNTKRLMAERKARQFCLTEVVSDRDETKKTGSTHQNGRVPAQNIGT